MGEECKMIGKVIEFLYGNKKITKRFPLFSNIDFDLEIARTESLQTTLESNSSLDSISSKGIIAKRSLTRSIDIPINVAVSAANSNTNLSSSLALPALPGVVPSSPQASMIYDQEKNKKKSEIKKEEEYISEEVPKQFKNDEILTESAKNGYFIPQLRFDWEDVYSIPLNKLLEIAKEKEKLKTKEIKKNDENIQETEEIKQIKLHKRPKTAPVAVRKKAVSEPTTPIISAKTTTDEKISKELGTQTISRKKTVKKS